jgi:heptosyltransferase-2
MAGNHPKILIIQTAFIGDVILATSLVESLAKAIPSAKTDILVRKGNESLLENNPHINSVMVWDKKSGKYSKLWKLLFEIRRRRYDRVINIQRFGSTGFLTAFSRARYRSGFGKNPFSFAFTLKAGHRIDEKSNEHEIDRNHLLLGDIAKVEAKPSMPRLYPSESDFNRIKEYQSTPYIVIAPASVWFTKQMPAEKWTELLNALPAGLKVIFTGSEADKKLADKIIFDSKNDNCINLCGQISFLESAALMQGAKRCIVNDSAPLHIASAVNAPVTAVFCSTIPAFGFGPLSDDSLIVETNENLECRPCGLHGKKECPEGHFKCGFNIDINKIVESIG